MTSSNTAPESAPTSAERGADEHTKHAQNAAWTQGGGFFQRFDGQDHACMPVAEWRQWLEVCRRAALAAAPAPEPTRVLQIGDENTPANRLATLLAGAGLTNSPAMDDLAALVLAAPAPVVGAGVPADWRNLAERCLRSMRDAIHYGETGQGRPPQQTCRFEVEELAAMLAATPQPPAEAEALVSPARLPMPPLPNRGHGHVFPRPDGMLAKCGGPSICAECARDLELKNAPVRHAAPSAPANTEPLTWHLTTAPKRPDADEQCLLWIRYSDGAVDWEAGFLDGDGWRLCESGGLVDGEVLAWAQPGGPRAYKESTNG